ncbi:MAG: ComF family protein [Chloroflexota bacterium]
MIHRDPRHAQGTPLLKRVIQSSLDLIYPPRCAGCGRIDSRWCDRCQQELEQVAFDLRRGRLPPLEAVAATGIHEGKLQQAIHALKYVGAHDLAAPLGERLTAALNALHWQIDTIIPVPLHSTRQRERGANQSQQLAEYVAEALRLPCTHQALTRWRDTPPQVGLNREQRQTNVRGAFRATTNLSGSILLLDDVFTTGATLQACAQAARDAGASAVYGLTISVARSPSADSSTDRGV